MLLTQSLASQTVSGSLGFMLDMVNMVNMLNIYLVSQFCKMPLIHFQPVEGRRASSITFNIHLYKNNNLIDVLMIHIILF